MIFTYVGESKRSWNSRGVEHKPGVRSNNESANRDHAQTTDHDIHPDYVEILERNVNRQEHIFLEALHSIQDHYSVNEHIHFIYLHPWGLAANKNRTLFQKHLVLKSFYVINFTVLDQIQNSF